MKQHGCQDAAMGVVKNPRKDKGQGDDTDDEQPEGLRTRP